MEASRTFWEQKYQFVQVNPAPPSELARQAHQWLESQIRDAGIHPVVVDLGAGGAEDAALLATLDATVIAVDFAERGLRHLPDRANPVVADLRQTFPFRSDTVDFVYSHLVISCSFHQAEVDNFFGEIYRILVPGGAAWLLARSTEDPTCRRLGSRGPGYYDLAGVGLHFFSMKHMRRCLESFEVETVYRTALQQYDEQYNAIVVHARKGRK